MPQDDYPLEELIDDIFLRQTHTIGMILNTNELAAFVHFPSANIVSAKLQRDARKTKKAPSSAIGSGCVLGINRHDGVETIVSIPTWRKVCRAIKLNFAGDHISSY